ncbi:hypothetical protein KXX57_000141 [Aspergillus fumigatus]|nr:hypothetical protein KXX42_001321 [Aspergillus fumigatus]KAH1556627.1 hypothetical protein KXX57_000141 [Aspergillus fumigatus]KAH2313389.1 hypothetical protein KXV47_003215 [Aspergillus fumigatus]KAH2914109.1 hypothetical protein KXW25_000404 [Aspergillus fumigatus]KAH3004307.1 hypothetical protein KXW60_005702 [Aspergillus fumigatus]
MPFLRPIAETSGDAGSYEDGTEDAEGDDGGDSPAVVPFSQFSRFAMDADDDDVAVLLEVLEVVVEVVVAAAVVVVKDEEVSELLVVLESEVVVAWESLVVAEVTVSIAVVDVTASAIVVVSRFTIHSPNRLSGLAR